MFCCHPSYIKYSEKFSSEKLGFFSVAIQNFMVILMFKQNIAGIHKNVYL